MIEAVVKSVLWALGFGVYHLGLIPAILIIGLSPIYIYLLIAKLKGVSYRYNRTAFNWFVISILATLPVNFLIVSFYLVLNQWG